MNEEPQILFEDANLIVVCKPAGLLSQGEKMGQANLVDWLRQRLGRAYVGLIHRLDRNTSGVMVIAKRTKAASRLSEALRQGELRRTYLGIVEGVLEKPVRWAHMLRKDNKRNIVDVVSRSHPQGKEATLLASPVANGVFAGKRVTLVRFELETGRSHQIRVQCAHENFPLLGDRKYGGSTSFDRPALHSHKIRFPHPIGGKILEFTCQLPEDMEKVVLL